MPTNPCPSCSGIVQTAFVTCTGGCNQIFHGLCVGLRTLTFRAWSSDVALPWCCSGCRRRRIIEPVVEEPEDVDYPMTLPTEQVVQIFRHLERPELLLLRLVCQRWKDIVDVTPSLARQLSLDIYRKNLGPDFEARDLFPALSVRLSNCHVLAVDHWWPALGSRLLHLRLFLCRMDMPTLIGMLQQTPNLRWLEITNPIMIDATETVSTALPVLTRLEEFSLAGGGPTFLERFLEACGSHNFYALKSIKLLSIHDQALTRAKAMIRSAQSTCREIEIQSNNPQILLKLSRIEKLHLRRLSLGTKETADHSRQFLSYYLSWHDVFQAQANTLTELCIIYPTFATNATLCLIGETCRNLKWLKTGLHQEPDEQRTVAASFLATMPRLESLDTNNNDGHFDFARHRSASLTKLAVRFTRCAGLREFLGNCPNIKHIILGCCSFERHAEDLFPALEQLSGSVQRLQIIGRMNETGYYAMTRTFSRLTEACLGARTFAKAMLVGFLGACPQLEIVKFTNPCTTTDDHEEVFQVLVEKATQLRILVLYRSSANNSQLPSSPSFRVLETRNIDITVKDSAV